MEQQAQPRIPATVTDPYKREIYEDCNQLRADIKRVAAGTNAMRLALLVQMRKPPVSPLDPEVTANVTLAYRHLEDASMRLGKALQALDGGVSVYDKATTVGA